MQILKLTVCKKDNFLELLYIQKIFQNFSKLCLIDKYVSCKTTP